MKHCIPLSTTECLIVLNSLNMLIDNPIKHPLDKEMAERIKDTIYESVGDDLEIIKENKND